MKDRIEYFKAYYEKNKGRKRAKRKARKEHTKKGYLLMTYRYYNNKIDWFPIPKSIWIEHFLDDQQFNFIYNNWELNKFDGPSKPCITKVTKNAKYKLENFHTITYGEVNKRKHQIELQEEAEYSNAK